MGCRVLVSCGGCEQYSRCDRFSASNDGTTIFPGTMMISSTRESFQKSGGVRFGQCVVSDMLAWCVGGNFNRAAQFAVDLDC